MGYERHEVVTRHIEYRVPVWADHGVAIAEFNKAYNAAKAELCRISGPQAADWDDWCRVVPGDECVIIRIAAPDAQAVTP